MRKLILLLAITLAAILAPAARANQSAQGWCETGQQFVLTNGLASSNYMQANYPQCTVTVYNYGTGTLATIYSNNNAIPTVLANPFTATLIGQWQFYAANGHYTVTLSNLVTPTGVIAPPVSLPDIILFDCTVAGACAGGTGSGDFIAVNSVGISGTTGNFNVNTPAAPTGYVNLPWQQDNSTPLTNISVAVPYATILLPGLLQITKDLCGTFSSVLVCGIQGNPVAFSGVSIGQVLCFNSLSTIANCTPAIGTGTVTTVSTGSLVPLFTASISTPTTTPALSFSLSTAAAYTFFGNCTATTTLPSYCAIINAMLPQQDLRRTCMIDIGADDGALLVNTNLGPQGRQCYVPYGATILEVMVAANTGTPNVIPGRNHAGTAANLVSSALATAASGGLACANATGTTALDGVTLCSATLQNTAIAAGDWLELESGTAGGVASRMSIAITFTVN